jgi:hypothetical protein
VKSLPCVVAFALVVAACGAPEAEAPDATLGTQEEALRSSIDFSIKSGDHYSTPDLLSGLRMGVHVDRTLSFEVMFPAGDEYTTKDPQNQGDWCKVMGFSTNFIHENSIRIGWRWVPAARQMELGFYGYIQGQRLSAPLGRVPLGQWAKASVRLWNDGESATVNGVTHTESRSLGFSKWLPTTSWVLETAYFGGDEAAPHKMAVSVRNIVQN